MPLPDLSQRKGYAEASDYAFLPDAGLPSSAMARWDANIEAIRTLQQLDAENRLATPGEQAILAQYSGFGDSAFKPAFDNAVRPKAWEARAKELRELVPGRDFNDLRASSLNAFYTNLRLVSGMWDALEQMGAAGDAGGRPIRVLEPSAGSGRFLSLQPPELAARSVRTAVENDPTTARVLQQIFPKSYVVGSGFEESNLPDDHFDIAISNVPFGNYGVSDPVFAKGKPKALTSSIHNYFFAKTLDKLRPGGVLAFITSRYTMDGTPARDVREYLAGKADLLGAVRLPENAFPDTSVVADVIFLRKRVPGEVPKGHEWVDSPMAPVGEGGQSSFPINQYYQKNPSMVLGRQSDEGSMNPRGEPQYTVKRENITSSINDAFPSAMNRIATIAKANYSGHFSKGDEESSPSPAAVPAAPAGFRYRTQLANPDGPLLMEIPQGRDKSGSEIPPLVETVTSYPNEKAEARIRGMVGIKDAILRLHEMERRHDTDESEVDAARTELRNKYEAFVKTHKFLNAPANRGLMRGELDAAHLFALEQSVAGTKPAEFTPAPILTQRGTRRDYRDEVRTAADAMRVSLNERGSLDFEFMSELTGEPVEILEETLAGDREIFRNPASGQWEPLSVYTVGNVRAKAEQARSMMAQDPQYQANVEELEQLIPDWIRADEITTNLGAPWVSRDTVNEWIHEVIKPNRYRRGAAAEWYAWNEATGTWVEKRKLGTDLGPLNDQSWAAAGHGPDDILIHTLRNEPLKVWTTTGSGDEQKRVLDVAGTIAVTVKAEEMRESFSEWLRADPERIAEVEQRYNTLFNSSRPRRFDGSHLTLPGMSEEWAKKLRPHQRDAIARIIEDGTVLLAHEVGFGKTAAMVGGAMERRRLGLTDRPVFVLPKASYEGFIEDAKALYPSANFLYPTSREFSTAANRARFLSTIPNGDWDGIFLTTEQFQAIPVTPEVEADFIQSQLDDLRESLKEMDAPGKGERTGSRFSSTKEMEKSYKRLITKLKNTYARIGARRDTNIVYFDGLGIDQIFVDEADRYKNLGFPSKMGSVKGVDSSKDSQRSNDLMMKIGLVQDRGGRIPTKEFPQNGVVFATGTPISNSLSEMWTMMRYLQRPELQRRGMGHFDAWAQTFGKVGHDYEVNAVGDYKQTPRFSQWENAPELSLMFQNVADVRIADEVPSMVAARPRITNEKGDNLRTTIVAPAFEPLTEFTKELAGRIAEPRDNIRDNMLNILGEARKASLDLRMLDPSAPANANGKLQLAAENIAKIHKQEEARKGTQLVFLDLGTPSKTRSQPPPGQQPGGSGGGQDSDDDSSETIVLSAADSMLLQNLYSEIAKDLVRLGVPREQISFIHDADTPAQKHGLLERVRDGDIRVLIGSTEKMGVGINVQDRVKALHHLDAPWRPRDIQQREGRAIRQGNQYGPTSDPATGKIIDPGEGVNVFQYIQELSFDSLMWNKIETKSRAINQMMREKVSDRTLAEVGDLAVSAAEAKALASGNPRVIAVEILKKSHDQLRRLRGVHEEIVRAAESRIPESERRVETDTRDIPKLEEHGQLLANLSQPTDFSMTVGGKAFASRPEAGQALMHAFRELPLGQGGERHKIGEYRSFDIYAGHSGSGFKLFLTLPATGVYHEGSPMAGPLDSLSLTGLIQRLDYLVKMAPEDVERKKKDISNRRDSLEDDRKRAAGTFNREQDYRDSLKSIGILQLSLDTESAGSIASEDVRWALENAGMSMPQSASDTRPPSDDALEEELNDALNEWAGQDPQNPYGLEATSFNVTEPGADAPPPSAERVQFAQDAEEPAEELPPVMVELAPPSAERVQFAQDAEEPAEELPPVMVELAPPSAERVQFAQDAEEPAEELPPVMVELNSRPSAERVQFAQDAEEPAEELPPVMVELAPPSAERVQFAQDAEEPAEELPPVMVELAPPSAERVQFAQDAEEPAEELPPVMVVAPPAAEPVQFAQDAEEPAEELPPVMVVAPPAAEPVQFAQDAEEPAEELPPVMVVAPPAAEPCPVCPGCRGTRRGTPAGHGGTPSAERVQFAQDAEEPAEELPPVMVVAPPAAEPVQFAQDAEEPAEELRRSPAGHGGGTAPLRRSVSSLPRMPRNPPRNPRRSWWWPPHAAERVQFAQDAEEPAEELPPVMVVAPPAAERVQFAQDAEEPAEELPPVMVELPASAERVQFAQDAEEPAEELPPVMVELPPSAEPCPVCPGCRGTRRGTRRGTPAGHRGGPPCGGACPVCPGSRTTRRGTPAGHRGGGPAACGAVQGSPGH